MRILNLVFNKITEHFIQKEQNTMTMSLQDNMDDGDLDTPKSRLLWHTILEPSSTEVGNIIDLNCGHA